MGHVTKEDRGTVLRVISRVKQVYKLSKLYLPTLVTMVYLTTRNLIHIA